MWYRREESNLQTLRSKRSRFSYLRTPASGTTDRIRTDTVEHLKLAPPSGWATVAKWCIVQDSNLCSSSERLIYSQVVLPLTQLCVFFSCFDVYYDNFYIRLLGHLVLPCSS